MSRFFQVAVAISFLLAVIQADTIDFDVVKPFPETKPTTTENEIGLQFKPQLYVNSGCHPYPAVDGDGNISGGSPIKFSSKLCKGSQYGSQVYGRSVMYKDVWAIMYAWYFPKDFLSRHSWVNVIVWLDSPSKNATISALSTSGSLGRYRKYSPPEPYMVDGTSVKILYKKQKFVTYKTATSGRGQFQDLVMWSDLTDQAREALETADFGSSEVPMIDDEFLDNLQKAYPF
ncbi:hypothetical protein PHYBOEH_011286 [Phytophthora boehmeriae]|uniref:Uncharacterized protein n=1 Tax=Phytophthora boehmeriae TaxID=109152 RepID=A0A8T1VIU0_9STRA|nr:hypothetical protein PHYBOEH_011286 [Phytophthora boehmeriae]